MTGRVAHTRRDTKNLSSRDFATSSHSKFGSSVHSVCGARKTRKSDWRVYLRCSSPSTSSSPKHALCVRPGHGTRQHSWPPKHQGHTDALPAVPAHPPARTVPGFPLTAGIREVLEVVWSLSSLSILGCRSEGDIPPTAGNGNANATSAELYLDATSKRGGPEPSRFCLVDGILVRIRDITMYIVLAIVDWSLCAFALDRADRLRA